MRYPQSFSIFNSIFTDIGWVIVTIYCESSIALTEGGSDVSPAVTSLGPVTDETAFLTSLESLLGAISFRLTETSRIVS